MRIFPIALVITLLLGLSTPAAAQFRSSMRTANKQYDINAYNLAIQSYLAALERRPDDAEALGKIADCYRHLNMMEEAARYYAQAVRQRDVNRQHFLEFGHVLRALGRYDEARQWYATYARDVNAMVGNQYSQSCEFAKGQITATSGFNVTPELLNTPSSDFGISLAGNDQVVFSSARTDLTSPGTFSGNAGNSLLVATIGQDRFLAIPYLLRNGYSVSGGNPGPVSYSPDGTRVVFTRNNFVDGTRQIPSSGMQLALFQATVSASGEWIDVRPFPFNGSEYSTGFATFTPDGKGIYYASDRPGGFGGYDIYASYLVGNSWSTPENLGPVVNSPGNEITPFFDGANLFFSSDWHHGLGGFDVFRSQQDNGRWTQIFHMGAAINSPRDDYGYLFDDARNIGYVVSNRTGGSGNEDIYRVTRSADNVTLVIKNASDGNPLPNAIVDFVECGEGAYQANPEGLYSFQAMQGLNCNLVIRKDGYSSTTVPLATSGNGEQKEIVVNLTRITETYGGKIVDYTTRIPLQGVVVRLTNRNTGNQMEAVTDVSGDYYVAMSPFTTYDYQITNPGYQDIVFALPIEDGNNRSVLGVIGMQPGVSGSTGVNPNPVTPVTPGTGGGNQSGPTNVQAGYAVQLAAISKLDLTRFNDLNNLGQVYALEDGGRYKVRLGVYNTRSEAEQALRNVKGRGYSDAWIVQEAGSTTAGTGTPSPGLGGPAGNPPATTRGGYMVQLAAYSKPQYFDRTKAETLGTITSRPKGNLTAMLVSNIGSLNAARDIRSRARSMGWDTAFIVQDQNGQLIKVE
ncbi:MAG: carboxypeptidase regulatory-like domain-containing protein [Bacteroidota bacterium]